MGLRLKKLLCFSPVVWKGLKELVRDGSSGGRETENPLDVCPDFSGPEQALPETFEDLEIPPEELV